MMKLIPNLSPLDQKAVAEFGIPAKKLMEEAGHQVAQQVAQLAKPIHAVVIVCGPGNNGGDGFGCARLLHQAGFQKISVVFTGASYKNESLENLEALMALPIEVIDAKNQALLAQIVIGKANFIVDALFGSGLSREITGLEADLIAAINQSAAQVIAVDIPSGVDGATGQILGAAVQAEQTVTFAAAKPGLYLFPGKAHAGSIHVVDIGLPPSLIEEDESPIRLITPTQARQWLTPRKPDAHKYEFGHTLIIAGSRNMPGASVLASEAAMTSGVGLVTLAAPKSVFDQMQLAPELLRLALPESPQGTLCESSLPVLQEALANKRFDAIALGPGLGHGDETVPAVWALIQLIQEHHLPLVLDADALNAVAYSRQTDYHPDWPRPDFQWNAQTILTPHLGEARRLLHTTTPNTDLLTFAHTLQKAWGSQVVLKTATTITTAPDGLLWLSPTGNSGMATAGSGDVLTGIITGLAAQRHAQGLPWEGVAPLGVYLHGTSGDLAAKALTEAAMRASDITRFLPHAFKQLLEAPLP